MSKAGNSNYVADPETLRRELEAEKEHAAFVEASKSGVTQKCPECGALGSLEEVDGELRCIDCDLVVLERAKLPGFGRR